MALAFGVLIVTLVVVGSLLIIADLNDNTMPSRDGIGNVQPSLLTERAVIVQIDQE